MNIPFNKPYLSGNELEYVRRVAESGKLCGNGEYTKNCQVFFEKKWGFKKALLANSCTAALEMAALLLNIKPGDEVIIPSYTFVSSANAFALRGAKIVFADSSPENPNFDVTKLESLITPHTKCIVPVHYAGVACDMDPIMALAEQYKLFVVEDAAQAIDSYYKGKPLGSFGHLAAFSFHEAKNITSGEGGMLVVNDERFINRAEIIREKGTNRAAFRRGEVDKYTWQDIGSNFLPADIVAAYLYAQLENLDRIQGKRKQIWESYNSGLRGLAEKKHIRLPEVPDFATNNGHFFYFTCKDVSRRDPLLAHLKSKGISAVAHFYPLHNSPYFSDKHDGRLLPNADFFPESMVRPPFFFELNLEEQRYIIERITEFFK